MVIVSMVLGGEEDKTRDHEEEHNMTYTTNKPTQPGWYWMKDGSAEVCVQVEIGTCDGYYFECVWQIGSKKPVPLSTMKGMLWAGPIPEPTEKETL